VKRILLKSESVQKRQPLSWAILRPLLVISCQMQNLSGNGRFEGLNASKAQLNQKLQDKTQISLFPFFFSILEEKILNIYD